MNYVATLGLIVLFIADYVGIIFWLLRTGDSPQDTIRFNMRGLFAAMTIVAIHAVIFAAYLSELSPLER
jgi:hypothetical protein